MKLFIIIAAGLSLFFYCAGTAAVLFLEDGKQIALASVNFFFAIAGSISTLVALACLEEKEPR